MSGLTPAQMDPCQTGLPTHGGHPTTSEISRVSRLINAATSPCVRASGRAIRCRRCIKALGRPTRPSRRRASRRGLSPCVIWARAWVGVASSALARTTSPIQRPTSAGRRRPNGPPAAPPHAIRHGAYAARTSRPTRRPWATRSARSPYRRRSTRGTKTKA